MNAPDLNSQRSKKARIAARIGITGYHTILAVTVSCAGLAVVVWIVGSQYRIGYFCAAVALTGIMLSEWYRHDLSKLPLDSKAGSLDGIMEIGLLGKFKKGSPINPASAWQTACNIWQGRFLINHLLLLMDQISPQLSAAPEDMALVWDKAQELATQKGSEEIDAGILAAALMLSSEQVKKYLATLNLSEEDIAEVADWQQRLSSFSRKPKPFFGGVGRDWAAGYTPTLDSFGKNISREIEAGVAGHYHTLAHADILDSLVHNLTQGTGGLALVGEAGTGKTSLTYALAQRLLEGKDENLLYHQIVSLNASMILSASENKLEATMLTLFAEAAHAGNIIIFLDEARLFFGKGTGAFDLGQVLMPLLQNRSIKIIAAFTPNDFQRLKTENEALAANLAVINITEPPAEVTMDILEDTALTFEQRDNLLITYQAVREAYRLSGQYVQEQAYPGRAITLMEQAVPYCNDKVMTEASVQAAVEKTRGVRVSKATAPEADVLLHLEDKIHERMINQDRAVNVVASALRRGRAGVANPNRPVGSFLFLGPTGVGKTELARSLAAAYFGNERQMIRLDMTEYQQPEDVKRLLESGASENQSLLMSIREQPFSVVLLDEIEKAHPNILNLLLQMLDEGRLTDETGKAASFKNAVVICTSNAGSAEISQRVGGGDTLEGFERPLIEKLIGQGLFKPELVNRFDEVVLFRPLNEQELAKVAAIMINDVNKNLSKQNVSVKLTDAALAQLVKAGYDPEFGARPMRRTIQKMVEDNVANRILSGQAKPGATITLDVSDLALVAK